MAKPSIASFVLCLALVLSAVCTPTNATLYVVGDALGWAVNLLNPDYLTNWTEGKTFKVGDVLVFNNAPGMTLAKVTKEAYESGSETPSIYKYADGPSINTVTLSEPGISYFVGSKEDGSFGATLIVNVPPLLP